MQLVTLDRTLEHRECKTKWLPEGQAKVPADNPEQTVILMCSITGSIVLHNIIQCTYCFRIHSLSFSTSALCCYVRRRSILQRGKVATPATAIIPGIFMLCRRLVSYTHKLDKLY
jgi:hypothetical protein